MATRNVPLGVLVAAAVVCLVSSARAESAEEQRGLDLLRAKGCLACHTTDGGRQVGPTFLGLFGSTRSVITDGRARSVVADEGYIERALREPDADVAEGYPAGAMPSVVLDEGERGAVLAALRHLSTANPKPSGSIWSVLLAALAFPGVHLLMSSEPVRSRATARMGLGPFQGAYSLVVAAVLGWLIWSWSRAPFIPLWPIPGWTRYVPLVSMPFVFVLMIAGYTTKNPTQTGQESSLGKEEPAVGVLRITRHPANVSNALWGLVHLAPNGDLASVLFFGSIALLGIAGTLHIERRRRRAYGEAWERFARVTSIVPFAAIVRGRNRFCFSEIGVWRVLLGLSLFGVSLYFHTYVIGASPYPF